MRMGVFRTASLVTAILVGASAGLVAADLRDEDPGQARDTTSTDGGQSAGSGLDPLDLGASMENLDCTQDTILVLDRGEDRAALRTAIVDYPQAKYLNTAESCPTMYDRVDEPTPAWVAYLGPFDIREGCRLRMDASHRSHYLTRLEADNQDLVKCLCELNVVDDDFPTLTPGMEAAARDVLWINQLQGSLIDLGRLPGESGWPNGTYDQRTIDGVDALVEQFSAREPDGVTNDLAWQIVRDRVCDEYDY